MKTFDDLPEDAVSFFRAHIQMYLTDPERAHIWDATPVGGPGLVTTLLLTTTGRKTGKQRHVPLLYVDNGGSYFVMGSKGGMEDDPVWTLNLRQTPECEIRVSTLRTKATARFLQGEERQQAWAKITAAQPVYLKYAARTKREIPVVLLQPVPG